MSYVAPHRRKYRFPLVPALVVMVIGLAAVCALLLVLLLRERDRRPEVVEKPAGGEVRAPVPVGDGRDGWTHKELVEHLNRNGARVRIEVGGTNDGRPTAWLVDADTPPGKGFDKAKGYVLATLCRDERDAVELAAAAGPDAARSGKFIFSAGNSDVHVRVRAALK